MQTVNEYLNSMCSNLYVSGEERDKIKKSIGAISDRMDMYFGNSDRCIHKIIEKRIFGSFDRNTMISRTYDQNSDIDYLIVFDDSEDFNPQTCLNWLRGFADFWYSSSIVKQSSPTIVIELQNIKFELVPAYKDLNGRIFIPKDDSNWQYTNIDGLNSDMIIVNKKYNYLFKKIIRIIKYWNIKKNLKKFKSYQLEEFLTEKFKNLTIDCEDLLSILDWTFFYLNYYCYVDEYVSDRINKAIDLIGEAKKNNSVGNYEKAIECIKKVLPDV